LNSLKRPRSLAQLAEWTTNGREFDMNVVDFLHHFKSQPSFDSLAVEPELLIDRFPEGHIADCYLAAMAVELATQLGRARPGWSQHPQRFSREPWFSSPGPHMRALLLVESPPGFRERNLFITANGLSVA
jgi:hypothetical protein